MEQAGLDSAEIYERQVISYRGITPQIHPSVFIAPGAHIIGDVTIGENSSVMRATVLDGVTVGSYSLIAAGSVVRERFVIPDGVLVAGVPARIIRELREEERSGLLQSAKNYMKYVHAYKE
jgi:carbonic anhydrase/acetyltransferase-like protein (isoleucine patch superfamily)